MDDSNLDETALLFDERSRLLKLKSSGVAWSENQERDLQNIILRIKHVLARGNKQQSLALPSSTRKSEYLSNCQPSNSSSASATTNNNSSQSFATPDTSRSKPVSSSRSRNSSSGGSGPTNYEKVIAGNRELKEHWNSVTLDLVAPQINEACKEEFRAAALIHAPFLIDIRLYIFILIY